MYQIAIARYPNREFRAVLTRQRNPRTTPIGVSGTEESLPSTEAPSASLDISSKSETGAKRPDRAPSRFGLNAKRTLLRVGGTLEEHDSDPSHGVFLTGTLPGSTPESMNAIARGSSWVVHRLKAWVAKRVQSKLDFYVWERQKRGALHLHYFVYCRDGEARKSLLEGFKEEWIRLLSALGKEYGCNMWKRGFGDRRVHPKEVTQAYAQQVHKGVGRYLSKYCSKEAGKPNSISGKYRPTSWWGCSRPLLQLLREKTDTGLISFSSVTAAHTWLQNLYEDLSPLSCHSYSYPHKVGVGVTKIQYYSEALWRMATQSIRRKCPLDSPSQKMETPSLNMHRMKLLETARTVLASVPLMPSQTSSKGSFMIASLEPMLSQGEKLPPTSLRPLRQVLIALCSVFTCQKLAKYQTSEQRERHQALIRYIWRIQDSNADEGVISEEKCKFLLQSFWVEPESQHLSTNGTATNRTPHTGTDLSQAPPVPVQLSILV